MDMTNCHYDVFILISCRLLQEAEVDDDDNMICFSPQQEAGVEALRGLQALGLPTKCRQGQSPSIECNNSKRDTET